MLACNSKIAHSTVRRILKFILLSLMISERRRCFGVVLLFYAILLFGVIELVGCSERSGVCKDTGGAGAVDRRNVTCARYSKTDCGKYDKGEGQPFIAAEFCCKCGGGKTTYPGCTDVESNATDAIGKNCSYYLNARYACSYYKDEDFNAERFCCSCGGGTYNDTLQPTFAPSTTPTNDPTTLTPTNTPTTPAPTITPTTSTPTIAPTTSGPTTFAPTIAPTTSEPTPTPLTRQPTIVVPTTTVPTTREPTTREPTTLVPTT